MLILTLKPSEPILVPETKFGGQPNWIGTPQWPVGRADGLPMRFICQVKLPNDLPCGGQAMAYVFMSDYCDKGRTWDPTAGDNAVILQPAPFEAIVETLEAATGPSLQKMVDGPTGNRLIPQDVEYRVESLDLPEEAAKYREYQLTNRIGEPPGWLQNDDTPREGAWLFLMQIDSSTEDLYSVNFGDFGVGYVFVSSNGNQSRFLWQCC